MKIFEIKCDKLRRFAECRRSFYLKDVKNPIFMDEILFAFPFAGLPENNVIGNFWVKVINEEITELPESLNVIAELAFLEMLD